MASAVLVLNAGSSSLKFSVFVQGEPPQPLLRGQLEGLFTQPRFTARDQAGRQIGEKGWGSNTRLGHDGAMEFLFSWGRGEVLGSHRIVAAGHRVVHGGLKFNKPVRIDASVLAALEEFIPLAPLHQPHNLAAIRALAQRAPELPQVACFDTAFHRTQLPVAQAFALPRRFTEAGVLRYGFHGLSYEYIASVLQESMPGRLPVERWWPISGTARACARCEIVRVLPARWASLPSMVCRWVLVAERSIPAFCCT